MSYKKKDDIRVDLTKLHPWLQEKIAKWRKACHKKGYYVAITQGLRTKEDQDKLYAQGRTKPGSIVTNAKGSDYASQHQWGIAFDFGCPATSNKEFYNEDRMKKMAKIAKDVGLAWGGDWSGFKDTPHLYLDKWGDTPSKLKRKYGTPDRFKKYWKRTIKKKTRIYASKKMSKKNVKKQVAKATKVKVLWYSKKGYAKVKYGSMTGYVWRTRFKKIK